MLSISISMAAIHEAATLVYNLDSKSKLCSIVNAITPISDCKDASRVFVCVSCPNFEKLSTGDNDTAKDREGEYKSRICEGNIPIVYFAKTGTLNGANMETTSGTNEGIAAAIEVITGSTFGSGVLDTS